MQKEENDLRHYHQEIEAREFLIHPSSFPSGLT
jgi:hypothetical protein